MRKILTVIAALAVCAGAAAQTLTILHVNDTHSHLDPLRGGTQDGMGGAIERAAMIDSVRVADGAQNVLLLHGGDFSQGTSYFTVLHGDLEIDLINSMKYDVITLGNHEFDNGIEELGRRLSSLRGAKVVCANYDFTPFEAGRYVKPYAIVEKAGKKIGVIGMLTDISKVVARSTADRMPRLDGVAECNKWAAKLKNEDHCDMVIVLSHMGYTEDVKLVGQIRNVDLIVGGHSHTFLKEPTLMKDLDGNVVPVVQDGCWGLEMGVLHVKDNRPYTAKIEKNYIMIPGQSGDFNSNLDIIVNGENIIGTTHPFQAVNGTDVEFYAPVDVSAYKGQTVTVAVKDSKTGRYMNDGIYQSDKPMLGGDHEFYKPKYHFSPYFGWTNDPNGMVYSNGLWHFSYQHNYVGTRATTIHWGHAVSKDLVHWTHESDILIPDSLGAIWSGSALVDSDNSAGFGKNALIAVYSYSSQCVGIAYSNDGGKTYTKYSGNPVIPNPGVKDFRDPKVYKIGGEWVCVMAVGDHMEFWGSKNLKSWEKLSEFGQNMGAHGGVWECPDLLNFRYKGEEKWVLICNINPGGPNGGSATQYFIGSFDGKEFKADDLPYPLWMDEGKDNYAGVTFFRQDKRHVLMGWMGNWLYSNDTPTKWFRCCMTVPRDLGIKEIDGQLRLSSVPSKEVAEAFTSSKSYGSKTVKDSWKMTSLPGDGAYMVEMTVVPSEGSDFAFTLTNEKGEKAVFSFDGINGKISLDRSECGITDFHPDFANAPIVANVPVRKEYKIKLYVDRISTEIFINDGDVVFTNHVFPTAILDQLEFRSSGNSTFVKNIKVCS